MCCNHCFGISIPFALNEVGISTMCTNDELGLDTLRDFGKINQKLCIAVDKPDNQHADILSAVRR